MQNRVTFEYAIIRVVPKVEREEFFNVGVLVFSKRKKFLGIKYLVNEQKLNCFACDLDLDTINNYLQAWEKVCKGVANTGRICDMELSDRFRWLAATRSTVLQTSKTHPGLSDNPAEDLERLFTEFVL